MFLVSFLFALTTELRATKRWLAVSSSMHRFTRAMRGGGGGGGGGDGSGRGSQYHVPPPSSVVTGPDAVAFVNPMHSAGEGEGKEEA